MTATRKPLYILLIATSVSIAGWYFNHSSQPFYDYTSWNGGEIALKQKPLNHYQTLAENIRLAVKDPNIKIQKEKSILAGLHWLVDFSDDDKNFNEVFSDLIILANEMTRSGSRETQRELAKEYLFQSLKRAEGHLGSLFAADEAGRWDFIGILPVILANPEFHQSYFGFYQNQFSDLPIHDYTSGKLSFQQALAKLDYDILGDYLIDTSFLHYFDQKKKTVVLSLPPSSFSKHMLAYDQFDYDLSHPIESEAFVDLAYLATHVALVLTNYGELPLKPSISATKVEAYLKATYPIVSNGYDDLDLMAEYIQCFKMFGADYIKQITSAESLFYRLQRADGSWGRAADFNSDPYDAFHPTWAVMTGLNHPLVSDLSVH